MAVTLDTFRELMSVVPAGVAIVTAIDADGAPRGLTSTAVCPVSASPPLVLVCVDRGSNTLPALLHSGGFAINFLATGQEEVARRFAAKGEDKFAGLAWRGSHVARGAPVLEAGCVSCVECIAVSHEVAGDHIVLIGRVEDGIVGPRRDALLYGRRTYGRALLGHLVAPAQRPALVPLGGDSGGNGQPEAAGAAVTRHSPWLDEEEGEDGTVTETDAPLYSVMPDRLRIDDGSVAVLLGTRCEDCASSFVGTVRFCRRCTSERLRPVELSRRGRVVSHTIVVRAAADWPGPIPYALAEVRLDEGLTVVSRLADWQEGEPVRIDAPVEVVAHPLEAAEPDESGRAPAIYAWRRAGSD